MVKEFFSDKFKDRPKPVEVNKLLEEVCLSEDVKRRLAIEVARQVETSALEEKWNRCTQIVRTGLEAQGLLATKEESTRKYQSMFGTLGYMAPERVRALPIGMFEVRERKIYLSPVFEQRSPDDRLNAVLAEARHVVMTLTWRVGKSFLLRK